MIIFKVALIIVLCLLYLFFFLNGFTGPHRIKVKSYFCPIFGSAQSSMVYFLSSDFIYIDTLQQIFQERREFCANYTGISIS